MTLTPSAMAVQPAGKAGIWLLNLNITMRSTATTEQTHDIR